MGISDFDCRAILSDIWMGSELTRFGWRNLEQYNAACLPAKAEGQLHSVHATPEGQQSTWAWIFHLQRQKANKIYKRLLQSMLGKNTAECFQCLLLCSFRNKIVLPK